MVSGPIAARARYSIFNALSVVGFGMLFAQTKNKKE
jgi:hypothetical protein